MPEGGAFAGAGETLGRKLGPLPLWSYAAIVGGGALAWRIVRGQGSKSATGSPFIPYVPGAAAGVSEGPAARQPSVASAGASDETITPGFVPSSVGSSYTLPPILDMAAAGVPDVYRGGIIESDPYRAPAEPSYTPNRIVRTSSGPVVRVSDVPGAVAPHLDFPLAQFVGGVAPDWLTDAARGRTVVVGSPSARSGRTPSTRTRAGLSEKYQGYSVGRLRDVAREGGANARKAAQAELERRARK